MAEEQDDSSKTEEPTPRRLQEARKRGEVFSSREINSWFILLAAFIIIAMLGPALSRDLSVLMENLIAQPHNFSTSEGGFSHLGWDIFKAILLIMAAPLIIFMIAALLGGLIQNGLIISEEAFEAKLERISPLAGAKRLFGLPALVEFAKALVKFVVVGAVFLYIVKPSIGKLSALPSMAPSELGGVMIDLSVELLVAVLAVLTAIAAVDWLYQRANFMQKMRMSRTELKEEYRQTEGDPLIKRKLAELRSERARKRMMAEVPKSTVVITNPTHYAVALKYSDSEMAAPQVVAKGKDDLALRIRQVAVDNDVPIIQNPPVARALYKDVEIDGYVPRQYYEIVARIIGYVMRLQGKLPGPPGPPPTAPADAEDL